MTMSHRHSCNLVHSVLHANLHYTAHSSITTNQTHNQRIKESLEQKEDHIPTAQRCKSSREIFKYMVTVMTRMHVFTDNSVHSDFAR